MKNDCLNWLDLAVMPSNVSVKSRLEYMWTIYLDDSNENPILHKYAVEGHASHTERASAKALARQREILKNVPALSESERCAITLYTFDSNLYVNRYLRTGKNVAFAPNSWPKDFNISAASSQERARQLYQILKEKLPHTGCKTLYRGGYGDRGTSGRHFRRGLLKKGDILVNSDFLSFTENPFAMAQFCKPRGGFTDQTSVVFILSSNLSARAMAPLSLHWDQGEDESLYTPLSFFEITFISPVELFINGVVNPLVVVGIEEQPASRHTPKRRRGLASRETFGRGYFDFRTGKPFDYGRVKQRLGDVFPE